MLKKDFVVYNLFTIAIYIDKFKAKDKEALFNVAILLQSMKLGFIALNIIGG